MANLEFKWRDISRNSSFLMFTSMLHNSCSELLNLGSCSTFAQARVVSFEKHVGNLAKVISKSSCSTCVHVSWQNEYLIITQHQLALGYLTYRTILVLNKESAASDSVIIAVLIEMDELNLLPFAFTICDSLTSWSYNKVFFLCSLNNPLDIFKGYFVIMGNEEWFHRTRESLIKI